ncbi:hypothetical protein DNTS_030008 [Danionella cerebrum]|uniref:Uncharacterized protein n=1 Tax=Danionella cerebrum TaxID=2873325 RepID=A0A553QD55_9TELE|nr:hypothetical protein DNTS_030008 [Danionella translucida]
MGFNMKCLSKISLLWFEGPFPEDLAAVMLLMCHRSLVAFLVEKTEYIHQSSLKADIFHCLFEAMAAAVNRFGLQQTCCLSRLISMKDS